MRSTIYGSTPITLFSEDVSKVIIKFIFGIWHREIQIFICTADNGKHVQIMLCYSVWVMYAALERGRSLRV